MNLLVSITTLDFTSPKDSLDSYSQNKVGSALNIIREVTVPIKCPECDSENEVSLEDQSNGAAMLCPTCDAILDLIDNDGGASKIADKLDKLYRQLRNIGGSARVR